MPALHLYFDERDNRTEETVLNDFPVRDKKLVLHIRHRRWLKPDETSCMLDVYPKLVAKGTRFSGSPAIFRGRFPKIVLSRYMKNGRFDTPLV